MKYKVLLASSFELLASQVNEQLDSGWVVQGGVNLVCHEDDTMTICQAMIHPHYSHNTTPTRNFDE